MIIEYRDGTIMRLNLGHVVFMKWFPRQQGQVIRNCEDIAVGVGGPTMLFNQIALTAETWDNLKTYIGVPDPETEKGNENG